MDDVLNWVWQGSAIAIAMLAALRLLARLRASARYALSAMALLTVLALPFISLVVHAELPQAALDSSAAVAPLVAIPTTWWTSTEVVLVLWSVWCAIFGVRLTRAFLTFHRARRECVPFPARLESQLPFWNSVIEQGRRARLVVSPRVSYAAVLGGASPTIAVAPALLGRLTTDELDRVVIHEWAHVQRRDDVLNVMQIAVRTIAGWHPAVIALERQLRIEREAACDEIAVSITGSAKRYAACLTAIAALGAVRHQPMPVVGALSSPALRMRIARILSQRQLISSKWSIRAAVLAVFALVPASLMVGGLRFVESVESRVIAPTQDVTPVPDVAVDTSDGRDRATLVQHEQRAIRAGGGVNKVRPTVTRAAAVAVDPQQPTPFVQESATSHADSTEPTAPLAGTPLRGISALVPAGKQSSAVAATTQPEPQPPDPPAAGPVPPWTDAANAGVAVGRGSQKAGVATASFFSRLGKKIAGSF